MKKLETTLLQLVAHADSLETADEARDYLAERMNMIHHELFWNFLVVKCHGKPDLRHHIKTSKMNKNGIFMFKTDDFIFYC